MNRGPSPRPSPVGRERVPPRLRGQVRATCRRSCECPCYPDYLCSSHSSALQYSCRPPRPRSSASGRRSPQPARRHPCPSIATARPARWPPSSIAASSRLSLALTSVSAGSALAGHVVDQEEVVTGRWRALVYSPTDSGFGDGPILWLSFHVSPNAHDGVVPIALSGAIMARHGGSAGATARAGQRGGHGFVASGCPESWGDR